MDKSEKTKRRKRNKKIAAERFQDTWKYIKFNGKHPAASKDNRSYQPKPDSDWWDYGASYPSGYMKVDIDDRDKNSLELEEPIGGKARSEAVVELLDDLNVNYFGIETERGKHLFFRVPGNMERKNKQNWISAINIKLEYKFPESDDHIPLMIGGQERKIFHEPEDGDLDELPFYLLPVQKSRQRPFRMEFPEGDRTNQLGGYLFHLVGKGFSAEQAFQVVRFMNKYVFENSIPEQDLDTQILNESTKEKLKEEQAGKANNAVSIETFSRMCIKEGISIRYNEVLNIVEYSGIPEEWDLNDEQNAAPIKLHDLYKIFTKKNVGKHQVLDYIFHEADTHSYNPVKEYLTAVKWDGISRFPLLFGILGCEDEFEQTLVRKWFYQTAAMPFNNMKDPFQAEGVLILQGAEGIGKSRFFQQIVPEPHWFSSLDKELNTRNKDILIQLLSAWVGEIGEIDRTFKANVSDVKNFITLYADQLRKPYRPEPTTKARTTSFCGTTNKIEFLNEETGFRRWWVVPVQKKINMSGLLKDDGLHQLWVECYAAFQKDHNCFRLTDEEVKELRERNRGNTELLPAEEELRNRFDFEAPLDEWRWRTPSMLKDEMLFCHDLSRYTPRQIGQALKAIAHDYPAMLEENGKCKHTEKGNAYRIPPGKAANEKYKEALKDAESVEERKGETIRKRKK